MRLHISGISTEQLFGPIDGQLLGHIHVFTTAVITLARVTFGVFVGELRALRLHHCGRGVIFAGNQFDMVLLTLVFMLYGCPQFRVSLGHQLRALVHVFSVSLFQGEGVDSVRGLKLWVLTKTFVKASSAGVLVAAIDTGFPLAMSCSRCCSAKTLPT